MLIYEPTHPELPKNVERSEELLRLALSLKISDLIKVSSVSFQCNLNKIKVFKLNYSEWVYTI